LRPEARDLRAEILNPVDRLDRNARRV